MIFLPYIMPRSISHIHGSPCCKIMNSKTCPKLSQRFLFYDARSIYESNLLFIWGSLSKESITLLQKIILHMPTTRVLVHIRGCQRRIDNSSSFSSLSHVLPINIFLSKCTLEKNDFKNLAREIRSCLKLL